MLRDEVAKYSELTGEDGNRTPIMKIGAYLDGYEKGLSVIDKIRAEIAAIMPLVGMWMYDEGHNKEQIVCEVVVDVLKIIDKYRGE